MPLDHDCSWTIYGSELSPFTLKLIALCDHAQLPYDFAPTETSTWHSLKILLRRQLLIHGFTPLTWPEIGEEDEYPLVPFLFGPSRQNLYDSTAIAYWLDEHTAEDGRRVVPTDQAAAFLTRLIDDYADEFGLYLVHHQRWKVSAEDNDAGRRLAYEFRRQIGPLQGILADRFSARQVRRLPYLFSVAPVDASFEHLRAKRRPPSRPGFPDTHQLLEDAFLRLIRILDTLLSERPFIFGQRFSLADAALYGQLAMNLDDPSSARLIQEEAPSLFNWLVRIRQHSIQSDDAADWCIDEALVPLLKEICETHVPLMLQNFAAYQEWKTMGENQFNEQAFDHHKALYDGNLKGQPFRHVAKSFQAKVWKACHQHWQRLSDTQRQQLERLLPEKHSLDKPLMSVSLVTK